MQLHKKIDIYAINTNMKTDGHKKLNGKAQNLYYNCSVRDRKKLPRNSFPKIIRFDERSDVVMI